MDRRRAPGRSDTLAISKNAKGRGASPIERAAAAPRPTRREPLSDARQAPRAQMLGRVPAANTGYSPGFVMREFPSGVALF